MNVRLSPQHEALIREKVASGGYRDEQEVIADALALLEQRDKAVKTPFWPRSTKATPICARAIIDIGILEELEAPIQEPMRRLRLSTVAHSDIASILPLGTGVGKSRRDQYLKRSEFDWNSSGRDQSWVQCSAPIARPSPSPLRQAHHLLSVGR